MEKKKENQTLSLQVTEGLTVTILQDSNHEFIMSTKQVAAGYGVTPYAIRQSKLRHEYELTEGKHFLSGVTIRHGASSGSSKSTMWTKRGVIRLGFFITSERSKLFRDWAEDLVLQKLDHPTLYEFTPKQLPAHRNHNRLTSERLLSIMADVCRIEDKDLRISISNKLMKGGQI